MNINYLLSILDLYLLKENDSPLIIEVYDNDNIVKIEFSYLNSIQNKTYIKLDKNIFIDNIKYFIPKIQNNLIINKENIDSKDNIYSIIFSNNRQINFYNFKDLEILRNNFINLPNNINEIQNVEVIEPTSYNEIYNEKKKTNLSFSMGFSTYMTLFLTAIWFLDIFMIALWIFKSLN